jgi:hypothetical protein
VTGILAAPAGYAHAAEARPNIVVTHYAYVLLTHKLVKDR